MSQFISFYVFLSLLSCSCCMIIVERLGNPDDFAEIRRPCKVYDIHCIRRYFAEHSKCRIANGPVPSSIIRAQSNMYHPRVNITVEMVPEQITGLETGRIAEFYVNEDTKNVVLEVDFTNLTIASNNTYINFYRKDREPITTVGFASGTFGSIFITAIIPGMKNLQLEEAEIYSYASNSSAPMVDPNLANSSDPQVSSTFAEIFADGPTDIQELVFTDSQYYLTTYIQYHICDFGLKAL